MDLTAAYERCRALHRQHGRTYYLATRLLPAWKRRHVHALYGFTRYADEIVDRTGALTPRERASELEAWADRFVLGLSGAPTDDPLLPAVLHTIQVFDIDLEDFRKFLDSMAMDLTVTDYETYADLLDYMEGSAAVIGTMMLPILESSDRAAAREPARQLGLAFQLTNFIRDVAEDLERGRIYLPAEDLRRFGVTREDLEHAARERHSSQKIKSLMVYEVQRARAHYQAAAVGIPMLAPSSQACMRAAFRLYGGILDEVEAQDHDVFVRRATVPKARRILVALRCLLTRPGAPVPIPGTPSDVFDGLPAVPPFTVPHPREPAADRHLPPVLDLRGSAA
ncbi:phytoene/squalene synthase family protein [Dactylosporangium cerinum]